MIHPSNDIFFTNHLFVTGGYLLWGFFFSCIKDFQAGEDLIEAFSVEMSNKNPQSFQTGILV